MLTYLDESYAQDKHKQSLLIGALFIPSKSNKKFLHQGLTNIKQKHHLIKPDNSLKEIKYSKINSAKTLLVAKATVDLFNLSYKSFFRAGIINYTKKDLLKMKKLSSGTPLKEKIKKAMLYTKIVTHLIQNNYDSQKTRNGVLLMDNLTRCNGDQFNAIIATKLLSGQNPYLKHCSMVDSQTETNQTIQICDLLLGACRNSLYPTKSKYKTEFKDYVYKTLELPQANKWKKIKSQGELEARYPKFSIKYYGVPYKY
ncbi:DUF3800 domain-containing protein [Patescibacteria group bacterium]|nr:DUF3800 domain-containing protein [Patescibacteria group bacterium]MBU1885673.1 DUF3800 domain-containing protein [Patescibacteria group bacterium]